MTREEAITELKRSIILAYVDPFTGEILEWLSENNQRYVDACKLVIEVLEQEPCEEMISRADMLDAIGHGTTYTTDELQKIIKGLPTVNLNSERSNL